MAEWNKNNRSCKTVWFTLYVLDQNNRPFAQSGNVPMGNLNYWRQSASVEVRKIQARSLAVQMHNNFILIRKAKLEPDTIIDVAIESMFSILMDETKTIADLAETVDQCYEFLGERADEI